jgi:hypothetical protein
MVRHVSAADFLVIGLDVAGFHGRQANRSAKINKRRDEQSRAGSDNAIIRHDLQVRPRMAMTPRGYPRCDGHAANTLLKLDFDAIEEGLTEEMAPIQWQQSRDEYKEFPLQVFRDHIHQEKRSRRARPYWMYQTKKN